MNETVKAKWVEALRSGDYQQGRYALATGKNPERPSSFCCLGVLCDLAVKEGVIPPPEHMYPTDEFLYVRNGIVLPEAVTAWAELPPTAWEGSKKEFRNDNGAFINASGERSALSSLNDDGHPFTSIATVIEENF